ncbi:hypothetical protein Q5H93_08695 [Hymenobacter sp. ASUV-10]|uniref:Outer membrane protein beta-barrel domain-containing protein n=1 Tax=Hymenobacter aranciens TaxID=3063996 RepID=A0ABT9B980_9BACT|nr:hypothetical protein [Hymenobacter sp. ASUV-10]MDO7874805.1 hypothetical protein [Hymenobacter sp. ASUV-10]
MILRRLLLSGALLGLGTIAAQAQEAPSPDYTSAAGVSRKVISYPRTSLGLTAGWGAPYGWGLDFSQLLLPNLDVTAGAGLGVGWKIGVGTRFYFAPQRRVSPFVGANVARTSGLTHFNLTVNEGTYQEEQVRINIRPTATVHLRGGVRCQFRRVGLIGALGYGVVLGADPVTYVYGYEPQYQITRDVVNAIAPGSFELSAGVTFGLSK